MRYTPLVSSREFALSTVLAQILVDSFAKLGSLHPEARSPAGL